MGRDLPLREHKFRLGGGQDFLLVGFRAGAARQGCCWVSRFGLHLGWNWQIVGVMKRSLLVRLLLVLSLGLLVPTAGAAERLFDGESFAGWNGNYRYFRVVDDALVGGMLHDRIPRNEFLTSEREYGDFELRLKFKLIGDNINAGIQLRSQRIPDHHEMIGYQADLGQQYWGSLYDESRRRKVLAQANMAKLNHVLDKEGWNQYVIRCVGRRITLSINGYQTVDYVEPDPSIPQRGLIALQIHSGPAGEAWYKDIEITEIEAPTAKLDPGVRGVATRASGPVRIDGDLSEFREAFATPVGYFQDRLQDRAAQFFYLWDETAFYAGLRSLDTSPANLAPDDRLWEGDGVEWYFDTRQGDDFRGMTWEEGAVHCYWVGLKGKEVHPRFCLRPGFLDAIAKIGVEVAAKRTAVGMDIEFKLPWANFPGFRAEEGAVIGVDAELCYSDGGRRVDRDFVFGSPLSVQQPASLARVQLVDRLLPEHWLQCGAVMMPLRCDTPWSQSSEPRVTAILALPPNHADRIGRVAFRVSDLFGATLIETMGEIESFSDYGSFQRAVATWPVDFADPGRHQLTAIVYDKNMTEMTRIAPRMVSVRMEKGF